MSHKPAHSTAFALMLAAALAAVTPTVADAQTPPDLALDVGNDGRYEWTQTQSFTGPERTRNMAAEVDRILKSGCRCGGCVLNGVSEQCTIPVAFRSSYVGNLTINDVELSYYLASILANVSYGNSFRKARGDCWTVQDEEKTVSYHVPADAECSAIPPQFTELVHDYPDSGDAIDDAAWRLLNETLDKDNDWRIDLKLTGNMSIQSQGLVGVQSLWGPTEMRLIVWV